MHAESTLTTQTTHGEFITHGLRFGKRKPDNLKLRNPGRKSDEHFRNSTRIVHFFSTVAQLGHRKGATRQGLCDTEL